MNSTCWKISCKKKNTSQSGALVFLQCPRLHLSLRFLGCIWLESHLHLTSQRVLRKHLRQKRAAVSLKKRSRNASPETTSKPAGSGRRWTLVPNQDSSKARAVLKLCYKSAGGETKLSERRQRPNCPRTVGKAFGL